MSIGRIQASTTKLSSVASPAGAAGGSAAERAYREAVKDLAVAQKQLTKDLANGAAEEIIEADKVAVQMAAAAVAAAAAAVEREKQQGQQQVEPRTTPAGTPTPGQNIDARSMAALLSSAAVLDLYA